jgi:hypothetical protein
MVQQQGHINEWADRVKKFFFHFIICGSRMARVYKQVVRLLTVRFTGFCVVSQGCQMYTKNPNLGIFGGP